MFDALVVTLREGVEAALVAGIILIYLRKTGREALCRWVYLGIAAVLFLAAVDLTTDALLAFFGGIVGIALAVLFGVSFVRGTLRVDLPRFFNVTAIVLFLLAAQLLIGGLHELGERGTIRLGAREMTLIGPIVRNNIILLVSLLALPLIVLLVPGRAEKRRAAEARGLSGPEGRLALAGLRRERVWKRTFAAAGIAT